MYGHFSRWSAATPFCSRIMSRAQRPAVQPSTAFSTRVNSRASRLKRLGMGLLALGLSQGAWASTINPNSGSNDYAVNVATGGEFTAGPPDPGNNNS